MKNNRYHCLFLFCTPYCVYQVSLLYVMCVMFTEVGSTTQLDVYMQVSKSNYALRVIGDLIA